MKWKNPGTLAFLQQGALALLAFLQPVGAWAGTPQATSSGSDLAVRFGALEGITAPRLSPLGDKLSFLATDAQGAHFLLVADLVRGGPPKAIIRASASDPAPVWCAWASESRLACNVFGVSDDGATLLGFSRIVGLDDTGAGLKTLNLGLSDRTLRPLQDGGAVIDWNIEGEPGHVLLARDYAPEESTGTRLAHTADGYGVEDVDLATLRGNPVEQAKHDAVDYISDGHGEVRLMAVRSSDVSGYMRGSVKYVFRNAGTRNWQGLAGTDEAFSPIAVDAASNVVYALDTVAGRQALISVSLDGSATRQVVFSRPDVDVDGVIRIGSSARVVGVSFTTDRRQAVFFDPQLKALAAALGKVLPGSPQITFVDASKDEGKLLILVSSDTNPGTYYLYDKATHHLETLLTVRPQLAEIKIAPMQAISYKAADGTMVPAYLTLPPSGPAVAGIVMPHGGPSARDEWGFDWLSQYFAQAGFAVIQPNYRGSSGYGEDWQAGNGFRSWKQAIGDIDDAGRWLVSSGTVPQGKLAIVGWSYGGYAALQSQVLDPGLYRAVVAIAPVTDLGMLLGKSDGFTNYRDVAAFLNGIDVRAASPLQNVQAFKVPVLMFHGTHDLNVDYRESQVMADHLKDAGKVVTLVTFDGLMHDLDSGDARTRMLAQSTGFLRDNLGLEAN